MPTTTDQQCSTTPDASRQTDTTTKALIVVMSDPKTGTEEALGRVFNALATAYDFKQSQHEVELLFQGTGTRWIDELSNASHPAHGLFNEVKDTIRGVSCGCADIFGGREAAESSGFDLVRDNKVPGTTGMPALQKYLAQGFVVLTF